MLGKFTRSLIACGACAAFATGPAFAQSFNYAEALQHSMFFYEVQRSGPQDSPGRVSWRGPSGLEDGADVGHDLTGGWYDAGDHVKFGFPMAYSATALAWGVLDFEDGYVAADQLDLVKGHLRHVNDYFLRCHTAPEEFWGQVGNGGVDHAWWGSAEVMQMPRPAYKIDAQNPGSDLAAETAAAMAATSLVFQADDPAYSAELLAHAIQLYDFADDHRGVYSDSITDAAGFYKSFSGYQDELCWGAIWLFRATGDPAWMGRARAAYDQLSTAPGSDEKSYSWGLSWDNKAFGCYALMSRLTGEARFVEDIERHLDFWTTGYGGSSVTYTPGGLAWLDQWGALRYASNTAFLALYHHDVASTPERRTRYYDFGKRQIDYALGANPAGRSYVCGFGVDPPVNPHHRTAHGAWGDSVLSSPAESRHVLHGALVGGPDSMDGYTDSRDNYINNEVATDYNALFSGCLAKLTLDHGGSADPGFPRAETPRDEYVVEASVAMSEDHFTEVAVRVNNHTAWPARIPGTVSFRLFVNLSEGYALGLSYNDYFASTSQPGQVTVGPLQLWDFRSRTFSVDVTFQSGLLLWPGGQAEASEEALVRIGLSSALAPSAAWDSTNDPSLQRLTSSMARTSAIPMFADGARVEGRQPPRTGTRLASPALLTGFGTSLSLDVGELVFPFTGGTEDVTVTSDVHWTVTADQPWISVSPVGGADNGVIQVTATAQSGAWRQGTLTVSGGGLSREVTIHQVSDGTCANAVPTTLPFSFTGVGDECWVMTGPIDHINSWGTETLEVNGVDLADQWVLGSDLPDAIGGRYFVRFVGNETWSHFEVAEVP